MFRAWDTDGSGAVDRQQFRRAIKQIGFSAPQTEVDALFDAMDTGRDGHLLYKEVHAALRSRPGRVSLAPVLQTGGAGPLEAAGRVSKKS